MSVKKPNEPVAFVMTGHEIWWLRKKCEEHQIDLLEQGVDMPFHTLTPDLQLEVIEEGLDEGVITLEQARQLLIDAGFLS